MVFFSISHLILLPTYSTVKRCLEFLDEQVSLAPTPGQSVRHTFGFPFRHRLLALAKFHGGRHGGGQGGRQKKHRQGHGNLIW